MQYKTFLSKTHTIAAAKLGGVTDQLRLAPSYRKKLEREITQVNIPTKAAVLLLFFPDLEGETRFLLTKRASYNGHHSKQISFPGGKKNTTDKSLLTTALRETKEEVGIQIEKNKIIKQLTKIYIPPSNFIVTPFVGSIDKTPNFTTNYEVESILTPRLSDLLDDNIIKTSNVATSTGKIVETPSFIFYNEVVWGATAMILSELKELMKNL